MPVNVWKLDNRNSHSLFGSDLAGSTFFLPVLDVGELGLSVIVSCILFSHNVWSYLFCTQFMIQSSDCNELSFPLSRESTAESRVLKQTATLHR